MFNRKLLKARAKCVLKTCYWRVFAILILVSLISGISGGIFSIGTSADTAAISLGSPLRVAVFVIILVFQLVISLALSVFLFQPLSLGTSKLLLDASEGRFADIGAIGYAFRSNYKNIVITLLMKELILLAFMIIPILLIIGITGYISAIPATGANDLILLLVLPAVYILLIPALMKMYDYYLVGYILADDADISWREALKKSKNMMRGNRFQTFVMNLSFFGWILLGACACGIGVMFVTPYIEATNAQLYLELAGKSVIIDEDANL